MSSPPDPQRGTYLPTGWRVVGSNAERIVERAVGAAVDELTAGDVSQTLYALQCTAEPVVRGRPAVERLLEAVTEEVRRVDDDCPRLIRDEEVARAPSRFGGLRYEVMAEAGREWVGELVWRAVHPVVAGAPITTHLLIEERPSFTRLSLRVTADEGLASVRGHVGAGQVFPAFLNALRTEVPVTWLGGPVVPHTVPPGGMADFVRGILGARSRDVPVAVLSPLEDGSFVVDPGDLAWDLLGRARLYVIGDHQQTFQLSDVVGDRRMSCYWGAVRCYLPGWSRHDSPFEHPLLVGERLADPVLRATWLGEVGLWMGRRVQLPPSIEERRAPAEPVEPVQHGPNGQTQREPAPATAPVSEPAGSPGGEGLEKEQAGDDARAAQIRLSPADPRPLIDGVIQEIRGMASLVRQLTNEVERLRTISAVRSSSTAAIERRLGRLEDLLEGAFAELSPGETAEPDGAEAGGGREEAPADESQPTLLDAVHDAAESHSDALVFLDASYRSAEDSPYEDPDRVRAILEAMARVARRRRDGVLGTSLREAFSDLGIDYRAAIAKNTPDRLREQYRFLRRDGELVEAEEHIVLGNTYDPRRCLRIYFSSRVPNEPRFVIGHVGRHFQVQSTT